MVQRKEITIKNIFAFIQGNLRYKLYYSHFKFLIRTHIRQQIKLRIKVMDRDCYINGSCKICGCKTTALQMANKSCAGNCYPVMMNKQEWCFLLKQVALHKANIQVVYKALANYPEYFAIDLRRSYSPQSKIIVLNKILEENK